MREWRTTADGIRVVAQFSFSPTPAAIDFQLREMRRDVRILLVGDGQFCFLCLFAKSDSRTRAEGVGKSTIITSLIKESFVAHVRVLILYYSRISTSLSGSTCCSRGYNSSGGHSGKRHDLHRRFGR